MKFDKKTLLRYVAIGVLAVLIGTGVYSLNASRLTGDQMPMPFGLSSVSLIRQSPYV